MSTPIFGNQIIIPKGAIPYCTWVEMLQEAPLHSPRQIQKLFEQPSSGYVVFPSEIRVHCESEKCDGIRRHIYRGNESFHEGDNYYFFTSYICTDCMARHKIYGFKVERQGENTVPGLCTKIYQEPQFGCPIPKRFFQIIGEENRSHFLQARRAIARGLGIGAYSYYRRIIENTKFDLVDSILKVAEATNALPAQITLLKKAQSEHQFSKAIEMLKDVSSIPAALLINGHNPLILLC